MDHFQAVVVDYLRADRAVFVNTECCIQLNPGANPDTCGPHWYCDALAINLREKSVSLCEVTYSQSLDSLLKRLIGWGENWPALRKALVRDCNVPSDWLVQPWVFIPSGLHPPFSTKLAKLPSIATGKSEMPVPKVTHLEEVVPWKYRSWNRIAEEQASGA
jgi:hypothetical protein